MPIVTLPGGELRDEIRQPLYDTITQAAAETLAGTRRFFSSVTSAAGVPKSLMQTNMKQAGQLETAVSFRCQGLCFDAQNSLAGTNASLLPVVLTKSSLSLNVGVKNYWQGPGRFACGRMQETGIAGTDFAAGRVFQQFGWAAIQPVVFQGKHVIDINPLQNFQVVWEILAADLTAAEALLAPAAATSALWVMSLKGLLRRPVQ
jgi:hypothetical protein